MRGCVVSALDRITDFGSDNTPVRKVPKADSCSAAILSLFDHLVGDGEYARRNGEAERLGGPKIDKQLELSWPFHRQVRWLRALQDPVDVICHSMKETLEVRTIGQ